MKKLLLFALLIISLSGYSQNYVAYKCTGNLVNIRKGPGKNFAVVPLTGRCGFGKAQLNKGDIVYSDGRLKNGFIHVNEAMGPGCWGEGWVSSQYLKSAVKCSACKGRGNTGRRCPECGGEGFYYCCSYTGMELCPRCGGIGYR